MAGSGRPVMEPAILDKLAAEVRRFYNTDFLKAAAAVCALAAAADDEVVPAEHRQIDKIMKSVPALRDFDAETAADLLFEDLRLLAGQGEHAKEVLHERVRRIAGHKKRARTLMRAAYLIITADKVIRDAEVQEFQRLCRVLDLDPREVWDELAA